MATRDEIIRKIETRLKENHPADAGDQAPPPLWPMENQMEPKDEEEFQPASLHQEMGPFVDPLGLPPGTPLRSLKALLSIPSRPTLGRQRQFNLLVHTLLGEHGEKLVTLKEKNQALEVEITSLRRQVGSLELLLKQVINDLSKKGAQADIENLYASMEKKVGYQEFEQSLDTKAGREDVQTLQGNIQTFSEESQSRMDLLGAAMEKRASYDDFNRLESLLEALHGSLNTKGSQKDVEKIYSDLGRAFQAIEDRMGVADGSKLWEQVENLRSLLGQQKEDIRRQDARILGISESQAILRDRLEQDVATTGPTAPGSETSGQPKAIASHGGDDLLSEAYLRFQREFRGDPEDLTARQSLYIDLLAKQYPERTDLDVVDLACGDGIFLKLLREKGWNARGVDLNTAMVRAANEDGLPVDQADALDWLDAREPDSIDVLTGFQFIEHLEPRELARLLKASRRALRPGGTLILETIYPRTIKALQWYFLDLTHARLVFPEMLTLLAETAGLRVMEWNAIHPVEEHLRLTLENQGEARANFEKLNEFLYGPQDYYLVAQKPL